MSTDIKTSRIVHVIEREDTISDGRSSAAQLKYVFGQLPAVLRHIPSFVRHRSARQVNPKKHYVWLFDNIAFRASSADQAELSATSSMEGSLDSQNAFFKHFANTEDQWQVEYVAAFFRRKGGRELAERIAQFCHDLNVDPDGLSVEMVQDRIQHFVDSVLPQHVIHTSMNHKLRHLHGPSTLSGFSHTLSTIPSGLVQNSVVLNSFPGAKGAKCFLPGRTIFAEPEGWGIISDLDDTIKVTMTGSALGVLKSTFLDRPEPVTGMPELYSTLEAELHSPAFFYVSASPYNLYPFLRRFRDTHFPLGPIMLREATWQNIGGLINSLKDVQAYKRDRIRKIHSWFPRRKFILIGDSTQKDPETYAEAAKAYPAWVRAIFIRRVADVGELPGRGSEARNSDERFETAFDGVVASLWSVFDDPKELEQRVSLLAQESLLQQASDEGNAL